MSNEKLQKELKSFQGIWQNGFHTGYDNVRNQRLLEERLKKLSDKSMAKECLEIGCGGGQWTKFMLSACSFEKIWCVDALSAEYNNFFQHVGIEENDERINYCQVQDFTLGHIPDQSIDFVFSYDVFCHISRSGTKAYLNSLSKKCKPGCILLIMYADAEKYIKNVSHSLKRTFIKLQSKEANYTGSDETALARKMELESDGEASPQGRWYWYGTKSFCQMCVDAGFHIIERDLCIDQLNPITLFEK